MSSQNKKVKLLKNGCVINRSCACLISLSLHPTFYFGFKYEALVHSPKIRQQWFMHKLWNVAVSSQITFDKKSICSPMSWWNVPRSSPDLPPALHHPDCEIACIELACSHHWTSAFHNILDFCNTVRHVMYKKERPDAACLWIILSTSLVFLAFSCLLWSVAFGMGLITAHLLLTVILLLSLQTTALVQLLGLLEELVEIKLSDNVILEMR